LISNLGSQVRSVVVAIAVIQITFLLPKEFASSKSTAAQLAKLYNSTRGESKEVAPAKLSEIRFRVVEVAIEAGVISAISCLANTPEFEATQYAIALVTNTVF
jgi:hypothetical protein